jgi:seryl-tRNA synthetase
MIDIRIIREHPDEVKEALQKLQAEAPIDEILALDSDRRDILQEVEALRQERNETSAQIGKMKDEKERQPLIEGMRVVNEQISGLEERLRDTEQNLEEAMYQVPNLPHESVPVGKDESENIVVRQEGEPKGEVDFGFEPVPHWELGPRLGIIDFERGVKLSGSRFYVLF